LRDADPPVCHLPDAEFVQTIRERYQGIPDEIVQDQEMLQFILPALRTDFSMNETYLYEGKASLDCPISAFGGFQDGSTTVEELDAWRDQTSGHFRIRMLPGDHFFINGSRAALLKSISDDVDRSLRRVSSTVGHEGRPRSGTHKLEF
jgi:medium-chain acyl-[acyl-carrier-protein] hydrolase